MKQILKQLMVCLIACFQAYSSNCAYSGNLFSVGDFSYYIVGSSESRTVEVLSIPNITKVVVPKKATYNGTTYTVIGIYFKAYNMWPLDKVESLELPSTIQYVKFADADDPYADDSHSYFSNLKTITVDTSNKWLSSLEGRLYNKSMSVLLWHPAKNPSMIIPQTISKIGDFAFSYSQLLKTLDLPSSITSIGKYAFYNSSLETISLPANLTEIKEGVFQYCQELKTVTLPPKLTKIGIGAFYYCFSLETASLPENLTEIEEYAFNYTNLETVSFPITLIKCGYAFYTYLKRVYCAWPEPPDFNPGFTDRTLMDAILYVPIGSKQQYETQDPWRNFWTIEEWDVAGVEAISEDTEKNKEVIAIVDINGRKASLDTPGVVIVRYSDGSTKKIVNYK